MNASTLKSKVLEEIDRVPEDRLRQVYDFVHYFRLGLETSKNNAKQRTMQFAGCWRDMPDEMFTDFLGEITQRRQQAFSRRRSGILIVNGELWI